MNIWKAITGRALADSDRLHATVVAVAAETQDLTHEDYAFTPLDGGHRGWIACWGGHKPRPGDYLLLRNGGRSTRYRVLNMDPCMGVDPPTMWIADLEFAPRREVAA